MHGVVSPACCRLNKINQGLRWLTLAGNGVGDSGACSLGQALSVNYALRHLDVSFNRISCRGAATLARGLKDNSTLENLQVTCML